MNVHPTQSFITKIKAASLGIFAAVSLSAATPCCPPIACPRVDIELCPASFCVKEEIVRAAAGLGCGRIITQCDLPLVITCPGKYSVAQDLNWAPSGAGQAGITVAANDVVIEFNGRTYKQTDSTQANCIGVLINPNLFNVQLLNGTIENISMWGVVALGGCQELLFDSINTLSCGYNGIDQFAPGSSGGLGIFNQNIAGQTTNPVIDVVIRNCNINNNYSPLTVSTYTGLRPCAIYGGQQVLIQNSNFNSNSSNCRPRGAGVYVLDATHFQGLTIENCNFNQNLGFGNAGLEAINLSSGNSLKISGCQFLDGNAFGGDGVATLFATTVTNALIENCLFQNWVTAPSAFPGGAVGLFSQFSNEFVIKNCTIQNYNGTTTLEGAVGFLIKNANDFYFEDCQVQDLVGSGDTAGVQGWDIQDARGVQGSSRVTLRNCLAQNIANGSTVFDPEFSISAGFSAELFDNAAAINSNIVFDNCIAQDVSFTGSPSLARGFDIRGTNGALVTDCISMGNVIGFALDNTVGLGPNPIAASHVTIKDCFALNNTGVGFLDNSTNGNNVLYGNYAYNPGSTGGNYSGNDAGEFGLHLGTPIRTWSFIAGQQPDPTTDAGNPVSSLDNINVV